MYTNNFYKQYKFNIHSQNGEDGIIQELFRRLEITNGYICEFGAWDGIHLSNTFLLIEKGFSGVYIEGDETKFRDLLITQGKYPKIIAINKYVDHISNSENSLDNILKNTNIPIDFDLLSIDIDSFDYQVWESLKIYKPKIVIIEINSSIDPMDNNHIHTPGKYTGTSFLPTYKLGVLKMYKFVLHTGNMFFVRSDLFDKLDIKINFPLENFNNGWL